MPLQFRKGTDGQRAVVTFAQGEPVWTTDLHQLWVGDGATPGGILITGGTGTSGGYLSTSSISAGSYKLQINTDGSLVFPLSNTLVSTQTFTISALGTTAQFTNNGVVVKNTATDSGHATLFVNQNTATSFATPGVNGVAVWSLSANNQDTVNLIDNYGTGVARIQARAANGTATAPTFVTTGNVLLRIGAQGYGATQFGSVNSAQIDLIAQERFNDAWKGGGVNISTVNTVTTTLNTSVSITSQGLAIQAPQSGSRGALFINPTSSTNIPSIVGTGDAVLVGLNKPNSKGRVVVETYSNTGTDSIDQMSTIFTGRRARGSLNAPGAVKRDDVLNRLNAFGYNGTAFTSSASGYIAFRAAEDFNTSANGGYIEFGVINTGTTATIRTTIIDQTGIQTRSINASVDIDAQGDINSQNNLYAFNNVTAGKDLVAERNLYVTGTGLVGGALTAGSVVSNSTVAANTNITAGGNITATGDITGNDFTASGTIQSTGFIYSAASIHAGTFLKADTYITATNNIYAGLDVRAGANLTAVGNVTGANFTATGTVTAAGAVTGASLSATGNVTAGATVQGANLVATALSSATTTNVLYYNAGTGAITYSPAPAVNPFDQSLNTTDSPTFAGLTLNGALAASTWTYAGSLATLDGNSLTITTSPNATHSSVLVNESGSASYPLPHAAGYAYWAIGQNNVNTRLVTDNFGSATLNIWSGRRARGTAASPTAVLSGETLLRVQGHGYGATQFVTSGSANISFLAAENFTDTAAGGKIAFQVLNIGSTTTYSTPLTLDTTGLTHIGNIVSTNGASSTIGASGNSYLNAYISAVNSTQINFADGTTQYTAWTGTVASISTSSVVGLKTIAWTGKLSDGTGSITTASVTGLSTIGFTGKLSDATGSISTSQVTGLSLVGFTNNYNDLNNLPTIPGAFNLSTVTNQALFTTSTVTFSGLAITTGTKVTQVISAGGYPLDVNGQALITQSSTQSVAMIVSNYTSGIRPQVNIRGYGQNIPGGTAATAGSGQLVLEGSRGTSAAPTATGSGDTIGALQFSGYDGTNWLFNQSTSGIATLPPASIFVTAAETFSNNGSTTTNAGTNIGLRIQPPAVQLNSTSRRIFVQTSWTTGNTTTNSPPILTLAVGQGVLDASIPTLVPAGGVGSFGTGSGRTNFAFNNNQIQVFGVTQQDTAPDNATITGTNILNFVTGRRNAYSGRRDALVSGDTVFSVSGNAQIAANGSGNGQTVGAINLSMVENAGASARGTQMIFQTVNTGTTTLATRAILNDRTNSYNSDAHQFNDKSGTFNAVSITTATAVFTAIPVVPSYTAAVARTKTGQIGAQIAISDSAGGGNPNGMIAFWDTTNSRWSYVHDNTAV